jgi:putative PIN family toxin of toxin-antitoxin system
MKLSSTKIVFDTNVWVSALITPGGVLARLFGFLDQFQSITSEEIIAEVEKVLHYDRIQKKRGLADEEIAHYIQVIRLISNVITVNEQVNLIQADSSDNKFLACARAAQATYIVSGDIHLTRLGSFERIEIIPPGEFLKRLGQEK